ncbi:MAG: hypothetical protein RL264_2564 [Bacteroidota bacterium]|jgi:integral membrane protein
MQNKNLQLFKYVALIEGITYLSFGITVPLKRIYHINEPNYVMGMAHGILFIVFVILLTRLVQEKKFSFLTGVILFISSLVPFGTFWSVKKYVD